MRRATFNFAAGSFLILLIGTVVTGTYNFPELSLYLWILFAVLLAFITTEGSYWHESHRAERWFWTLLASGFMAAFVLARDSPFCLRNFKLLALALIVVFGGVARTLHRRAHNVSLATVPKISTTHSLFFSINMSSLQLAKAVADAIKVMQKDQLQGGQSVITIMAGADSAQLNFVVRHCELVRIFHMIRHTVGRSSTDMPHREQVLKILCMDRRNELECSSRAVVLHAMMSEKLISLYRTYVLALIKGTYGGSLFRVFTCLDGCGDIHNSPKLLYTDLDRDARNEIMDHIRAQRPTALRWQSVQRSVLEEQGLFTKIISDVDDTLFCSHGSHPAGVDTTYPKHTLYPGVMDFYREMEAGPRAFSYPKEGHNLVFLSARPHLFSDWTESKSYTVFKRLRAQHKMRTTPGLLPGDLRGGLSALWKGTFESMARKKATNWAQFTSLYPPYSCVLVGDNGQGDLRAAQMIVDDSVEASGGAASSPQSLRYLFLHIVMPVHLTHGYSPALDDEDEVEPLGFPLASMGQAVTFLTRSLWSSRRRRGYVSEGEEEEDEAEEEEEKKKEDGAGGEGEGRIRRSGGFSSSTTSTTTSGRRTSVRGGGAGGRDSGDESGKGELKKGFTESLGDFNEDEDEDEDDDEDDSEDSGSGDSLEYTYYSYYSTSSDDDADSSEGETAVATRASSFNAVRFPPPPPPPPPSFSSAFSSAFSSSSSSFSSGAFSSFSSSASLSSLAQGGSGGGDGSGGGSQTSTLTRRRGAAEGETNLPLRGGGEGGVSVRGPSDTRRAKYVMPPLLPLSVAVTTAPSNLSGSFSSSVPSSTSEPASSLVSKTTTSNHHRCRRRHRHSGHDHTTHKGSTRSSSSGTTHGTGSGGSSSGLSSSFSSTLINTLLNSLPATPRQPKRAFRAGGRSLAMLRRAHSSSSLGSAGGGSDSSGNGGAKRVEGWVPGSHIERGGGQGSGTTTRLSPLGLGNLPHDSHLSFALPHSEGSGLDGQEGGKGESGVALPAPPPLPLTPMSVPLATTPTFLQPLRYEDEHPEVAGYRDSYLGSRLVPFRTYVGAALKALRRGLIHPNGLARICRSAVRDFEAIVWKKERERLAAALELNEDLEKANAVLEHLLGIRFPLINVEEHSHGHSHSHGHRHRGGGGGGGAR